MLCAMTYRHPWIELISRRFFEVALQIAFREFVEAYLVRRGDAIRLGTADDLLTFMGEPPFRPLVLGELDAYMAVTGTKAYVLGGEAVGDPSYVARLREGVSPLLGTLDQARRWMGRHSSAAERRAITTEMVREDRTAGIAIGRRGPLTAKPRTRGGNTMTNGRTYMSTREAAAYLRLKRRTLETYRVTGGGPPYRRFGRHVRYEIDDLDEWADNRFHANTSDEGPDGPGRNK